MKDIIIYGAGGLAKETVQLIEDINSVKPQWNILGYIDDFKGDCGEYVNGYRILGGSGILKDVDEGTCIVLALGDPEAKKAIHTNISCYNLTYPVLIHPTAVVAPSAIIGEGSVVGIHCVLSVNTVIGKHVLLNTKTFVAHDSCIQDFSSCFVNCIVNGNVTIGQGVLLGSNTVIMERKTIGGKARISMGSIVTFDVEAGHVVMTKPSKSMFFG